MTNGNGYEVKRVTTVAFTLYPIDIATIEAHAKDMGLNQSAGLRDIIREWRNFKADQAGLAVQDSDDGR